MTRSSAKKRRKGHRKHHHKASGAKAKIASVIKTLQSVKKSC